MASRGARRHLVTLESPSDPVPDGHGGFTQAYTALSPSQLYAEIKPATVRDMERLAPGTVTSSASHLLTMDFHSDVDTETRVSWVDGAGRSHTANVIGVIDPDSRGIEMILTAVEVVQ